MRKLLFLIFTLIIICGSFVIAQTRPSCETPTPFWSPRPTTTQGYVNAICSGGDACYQAWCNYFRPNPGNYQHLNEIPTSYYTQTYTQTSCTGTCKTNACTNYQSCSSTTGTCTSGNCCTGSCTTATQTCIQTGGTCKPNTCTSYQSCSSVTGTCTTGNCCSGSCTTPTTETVNTEELKTVLINAIKYYFSSQIPKLTVNELKDLIVAYLQTSGNTADLSGNGKYTGQKLIDVYNKAKGTTICIPNCAGKCGGVSDGCGGTCNAVCTSGPLGSKTNPIKLNKPMSKVYNGYMSQTSGDNTYGTVNLPAYTKLYFKVDPLETIGKSARSFGIDTKFYNNVFPVCESIYDKRTQTFSTETCGYPSTFFQIVRDNQPNDLDYYKYLYAIDNSGGATSFIIDIWATIAIPEPVPIPVPIGPLGSKTNPIPIDKFYGGRSLIYYPSTAVPNTDVVNLGANSKIYFVVDSLAATGKSVKNLYFLVKGFNNANLIYTIVPQSKATGQDLAPEGRIKYGVNDAYDRVDDNTPYELDDTRFLYAIENRGDAFAVEIWVQFMPQTSIPTPIPAPTPSGPLGSKTNPLKLNTSTPDYPNTRYATAASASNEGELFMGREKTWFVIDPLTTKGRSVSGFGFQVATFNQPFIICKGILQDKTTGQFFGTEVCRTHIGFRDLVYDNGEPYHVKIDNTRFLYSIENYRSVTATILVVAEIP